jgi:hypothetical protein
MQYPSRDCAYSAAWRNAGRSSAPAAARREQRVRLRVPQGIGHRNLLLLNVAADGTVEMLESEAESFLRAGWERVEAGDLRSSQEARDPQKPEPLSVIEKSLGVFRPLS